MAAHRRLWLLIGCAVLAGLVSSSVGVTQTTFTLTVTKTGSGSGTVTSNPAGINCDPTCSAPFASGTSVTLTAAAASGSIFTGWSGACSGTGTCTVVMNANKSVTANFAIAFTLTVNKAGSGSGTVKSSPAGIDCGTTCSTAFAPFASGTSVTLTATAASGSIFTGWSGDCSGTGTCTVVMNANKSVTATFSLVGCYNYADYAEGTSKNDVCQPASVTVSSVTIRGDGNGIFPDGPNPCPATSCGNDKIIGTGGNDTIFGDDGFGGIEGTGHDWISSGDGDDTVYGEQGNDQIFGGAGNDMIDGGPGNDFIEGGPGTDMLFGGGGNDTFLIRAGDAGNGAETIVCTEAEHETGRVLLRGSEFRGPFGRYSNTTLQFADPKGGAFEIISGPGICVIRRG